MKKIVTLSAIVAMSLSSYVFAADNAPAREHRNNDGKAWKHDDSAHHRDGQPPKHDGKQPPKDGKKPPLPDDKR